MKKGSGQRPLTTSGMMSSPIPATMVFPVRGAFVMLRDGQVLDKVVPYFGTGSAGLGVVKK